uniref:ST8 alpha-N-acetyl-neuraminide alpha-2,8-sialyltransferase 6 n=1 Tax=Pelusios castaneus TaxID=367368 RepID=A0A8C8SME6_9SAUR
PPAGGRSYRNASSNDPVALLVPTLCWEAQVCEERGVGALGQYRYSPCPLPDSLSLCLFSIGAEAKSPLLSHPPPSLSYPPPPCPELLCPALFVPPLRRQLAHCCNASAKLVLTQENAPLGSRIVYDGQRAERLLVQEDLLEILPKGSPFQGPPYERCAVVGNGGILRNSSCGPEIDRTQFVIRLNLPSLGFVDDVGSKSSVVTLNPSILFSRYGFWGLTHHRRPFVEAVGAYGAPLLLIPGFSFAGHNEVALQALYTLEDFGSPARTLFMNPEYLAALDGHWRRHGFCAQRLSSGFMLVSAALELCQHLTLYGFWPFPWAPDGQPLSHHYYDNQAPTSGIHTMPAEFTRYLAMHLQGVVRLHLGRCESGPSSRS